MIGSARRQKRIATLVGVVILAATLGGARTAYAQAGAPYTFTKIQYPGSIYTDATGITNAGLIAGTYQDASGTLHGYTFDGTTYTTVDFPGANVNYAIGIGNSGQVIGTYAPAVAGPYHAFILDQGTFTSFDYPGMETDARGINSSGQIAGVYNAGGSTAPHSFVKTGNSYAPIDFPGAAGTEAWGINDAGTVSGNYFDSVGGLHGFIYAGGIYTAVNFPGASLTRLTRVNNLNQAVGWHSQGDRTLGFVMSGTSYRSVSYNDADSTIAAGINDSGRVVGRFTGPDCPAGCGFLATPRAGTPPCDQHVTVGYSGSVLTVGFNLTTALPTTWSTFLFVQNALVPLWSVSIPAISPAASFSVPIAGFPHVGTVYGVTLLSTATSGVLCADFGVVNTGP